MTSLSLAFDVLARDHASATFTKVGDAAERSGKRIEHSSGRATKAFGLLGKTFASSSAGALGPLQELAEKFEVFESASEQGGSKAAAKIFGVGLAATAAGSFIESLHSKEQGALQQLQASIATTGRSYDTYAEDVEKAVKSGEHFGNQAATTVDALNRLVTTTHNPEEAFKGLSVAIDVAAEKHIPLAKAAELVGLTFNGSTRAGKQFGLQLENTTGAAKALGVAQHASVTATTAVKNAQTAYTEKLDLWNNSATHTRAQAFALRDAHTRLTDAQDRAAEAAERVKQAQEKASDAHEAGARNVAKLAAVVQGQGNAAADTFTGRLKAMGAQIEDTLGAQGKLGGTLVTVGVLASGIGALGQAGVLGGLGKLVGRLGLTGSAFKTLRDVEVVTSAEGAAAVEAGAAAGSAALITEGNVALTTAARMRTAFAGIGALGAAAFVALGAIPDQGKLPSIGKDISAAQTSTLVNLLAGKQKVSSVSDADLAAIDKFLATQNDKRSVALKTLIDGILAQRAPTHSYGYQVSAALQKALDSDDPKVAARARAQLAKLQQAAVPVAAKSGKTAGDAYLKGLLAQVGSDKAASDAAAAAEKQAQAMIDAISGKFEAAKSRLQSLVSESLSLRQSVTSSLQGGSALTDIFQGQDLNANGAFGKQNNFGRVQAFLQKRVALLRKFVLELRALMKRGLDPSLVAQIAQAGVDGGQRIAEAILSGGSGAVGTVNSLERQISSLANTTGKSVADDHFAKQIAEQRHTTEVLGHKLDVLTAATRANKPGGKAGSVTSSLTTTGALQGL